jgi:hypothetical protein
MKRDPTFNNQETLMSSKKQKQPIVRKSPARGTVDAKRVRFGGGMAPVCVAKSGDAATRDTGRIRFGGGMISAALKK